MKPDGTDSRVAPLFFLKNGLHGLHISGTELEDRALAQKRTWVVMTSG